MPRLLQQLDLRQFRGERGRLDRRVGRPAQHLFPPRFESSFLSSPPALVTARGAHAPTRVVVGAPPTTSLHLLHFPNERSAREPTAKRELPCFPELKTRPNRIVLCSAHSQTGTRRCCSKKRDSMKPRNFLRRKA